MPELGRRPILAGLAAAPLAACTATPRHSPTPDASGSPGQSTSPSASASPGQGTVTAAIFNGGFGTHYVAQAADILRRRNNSVTVNITPLTNVTAEIGPLLTSDAPDLLDNSGPHQLALAALDDELADLSDFLDSPNLEGRTIRETLYAQALTAGEHDNRQLGIDYALSVYGLWYSASKFAAEGWAVPSAWDELFTLGQTVQDSGVHLFVWSADAASYYLELAITSAVKEGGHELRKALDNLAADCWQHPAMTLVLDWLGKCVTEGMLLRDADYLTAQTAWARDRKALLYPAGSWLARETAQVASSDFQVTVAPAPTISAAPTLPASAIHAASTEQFVIPSAAKNSQGGKELLRVLLSEEACAWFARHNLMPTVVRGTVPTDMEAPALTSQTRLLADAGEHTFSWRFDRYYGLTPQHNELMTEFLSGALSAVELAKRLQELTDRTREDNSLTHYTVE